MRNILFKSLLVVGFGFVSVSALSARTGPLPKTVSSASPGLHLVLRLFPVPVPIAPNPVRRQDLRLEVALAHSEETAALEAMQRAHRIARDAATERDLERAIEESAREAEYRKNLELACALSEIEDLERRTNEAGAEGSTDSESFIGDDQSSVGASEDGVCGRVDESVSVEDDVDAVVPTRPPLQHEATEIQRIYRGFIGRRRAIIQRALRSSAGAGSDSSEGESLVDEAVVPVPARMSKRERRALKAAANVLTPGEIAAVKEVATELREYVGSCAIDETRTTKSKNLIHPDVRVLLDGLCETGRSAKTVEEIHALVISQKEHLQLRERALGEKDMYQRNIIIFKNAYELVNAIFKLALASLNKSLDALPSIEPSKLFKLEMQKIKERGQVGPIVVTKDGKLYLFVRS